MRGINAFLCYTFEQTGANLLDLYVHVNTRNSMTSITVRVPDELRKRMKKLSEINWSEVVRKAIEGRVALEMARREKDKESILEAGKQIDAVYERLKAEYGAIKFDSSETVRYWRDRRYGATS